MRREEWSGNAGPCKQVKILRIDTVEPQRSLRDPLPGGGWGKQIKLLRRETLKPSVHS